MSFEEALNKIIDDYGFEILKDTFRTYSLISDYVGSSIYDSRLAKLFECVYYCFNLYELFKEKGLSDARKFLEKKYDNFSEYTKREFVDAINPLAKRVCPDEYIESSKKNAYNKQIVKQRNNQVIVKPAVQIVNTNNNTKVNKRKKKPKNINTNYSFSSIVIHAKTKNITIQVTAINNSIVLDGKTLYPGYDVNAIILNKILDIKNLSGKKLTINVNDKNKLDNIIIDAPDSNITLETKDIDTLLNKLVVKAKSIKNNGFGANTIELTTKQGNIINASNFKDIKIESNSGRVTLLPMLFSQIRETQSFIPSINVKTTTGDINILFEPLRIFDGLIIKKIKKNYDGIIKLKNYLMGKIKVNLKINTRSGMVLCK